MNKGKVLTLIGIVALAVMVGGTLPLSLTKAQTGHEQHGHMDKMSMAKHVDTELLSLEKIHSGHLPMVSQSVEKAIKAIETGNKVTALAELRKTQRMLVAIKAGIGKHVKPKFVNDRCPVMGSPINPDKVSADLVRDYKGQKVAFCCAGCPAMWDKLTTADKDAKLAKAKPAGGHSEHSMH